jgi:hypothetical protein
MRENRFVLDENPECQMPSVRLRALLVYDQSLLPVCPPGRTLCNHIIGVTLPANGLKAQPVT